MAIEYNYPDSHTHSDSDVIRAFHELDKKTGIQRPLDQGFIDTGYNPVTGVSSRPMHGRPSDSPSTGGIDMTGVGRNNRFVTHHL